MRSKNEKTRQEKVKTFRKWDLKKGTLKKLIRKE